MARPSRRWPGVVALAALVVVTACSDADDGSASPPSGGTTPVDSPAPSASTTGSVPVAPPETGTAPAATTTDLGTVDAAVATCARTGVEVAGTVAAPQLVEASGLVASRRHAGVLWSHNDGDDGRLFAVGVDGGDLGEFPVDTDGLRDVEDVALVGGNDGDVLLLADIGDNQVGRDSIEIHRVAEPDPSAPGAVGAVEVLSFVYPDRPHDAEALLVDERANRIVVVTKEQQFDESGDGSRVGRTLPSFVFEGPLDPQVAGPVELVMVGTIDTVALEDRVDTLVPHPASLLGFGGVVTGGDVSPDGSLVALRTYEAVWLWTRVDGQTVAEALTAADAPPCRVESAVERQGEAVAFLDGALLTVSEGEQPLLHRLAGT